MKPLAHGAGYLIIDHRDSPGLTEADVASLPGVIAVAGGSVLERDTTLCTHCQRQVLLNPGRVRQRAVCPKCHAYLCDECEAVRVASSGACVPFALVLDRAEALLVRHAGQLDHPALDALNDVAALSAPSEPLVVVP